MGFFSSRKAEDNDAYQVTIGVGDKSVVKVIRSRFYGKKGKEREDQSISYSGGATAAAAPNPSPVAVASSPATSSPPSKWAGATSSLRRTYTERSRPSTPTKKAPPPPSLLSPSTPSRRNIHLPTTSASVSVNHVTSPSTPSGSLRIRIPPGGSASSSHPSSSEPMSAPPSSSTPRKPTDTVTATLAQRLNELALANSDGLLTDDEYRLLRQNLFERFASGTMVPTETPVVPASPQRRPPKAGASDRPTARPLSNFQVERPSSTYSARNSITSGVVNLFRKGSKRSSSRDASDTSSVWSATSNKSNIFRIPRMLSKKSSASSIRTTASRNQADSISISSKRVGSDRGHGGMDASTPYSPGAPRSTAGSIRRMAVPPSSFPSKIISQESRLTSPIYNVFDEDNSSSVAEIQQEILNIEAEARRLMDAFNGLELTALTKAQRRHARPSLKSVDFGRNGGTESAWGGDSDGRSQRVVNLADDAMSMRSGTSVGTAPSVSASLARSIYSTKKVPRAKPNQGASSLAPNGGGSRPGSLHRKNSSSSVTSEWRHGRMSIAPPVPALPNSLTQGLQIHKSANGSAVSLVRSINPPMNTVPEDGVSVSGDTLRLDPDGEEAEQEMEDIRRRRDEVQQRYEARLDYLRAKLKGAQLHEKLVRK